MLTCESDTVAPVEDRGPGNAAFPGSRIFWTDDYHENRER